LLFVIKGGPDDLGRRAGDDVVYFSGRVGWAYGVGVSVLRTGCDDREGSGGDTEDGVETGRSSRYQVVSGVEGSGASGETH